MKRKKKPTLDFGLRDFPKITKWDLEFVIDQLVKRKHRIDIQIIEGGLTPESLLKLGRDHARLKSMIIRLEESLNHVS